ncbi:MAG TPA: glycosyltransferase 87 family protein, partial [Vicinamibacteria bacterium]|nr:glycosyltransferase 87 family protein [Vicinamibacteria bacterium]
MTRPAPSPDTKPTAAPPRQLRRAIVLLLLAAAVQLALVSLPDTMGDVLVYRLWTRGLAGGGLAAAYWPAEQTLRKDPVLAAVDYPPLFPYLLWGIGHALGAISPALLEHHDGLLDALIRLPGIVASLLLAWLVYVETRRLHPAWAEAALAMVALNPALVFDTAYWGQTDALCAALMAAALVGLVRGRPGWAWVAAAAAALAKPFAYPMLPVLAVASQRWFGPWRTLRSAALGASVFAAGLLPFLWIGRLSDLVRTLFWQLDAMPFVSVNAHNLWWLIGRGTPWTPASARPLGISWGALAALAFLGFLALVLLRLARSEDRRSLYVAAATGAFGFFVLSTHMHENHLFYAVAWLGLAGLRSAPVRTLFLALTATLLANMALHDPFLTHTLRA